MKLLFIRDESIVIDLASELFCFANPMPLLEHSDSTYTNPFRNILRIGSIFKEIRLLANRVTREKLFFVLRGSKDGNLSLFWGRYCTKGPVKI